MDIDKLMESFINIMSEFRREIQNLEYTVKHLKEQIDPPDDSICTDKTQLFDKEDLSRRAAAYRIKRM